MMIKNLATIISLFLIGIPAGVMAAEGALEINQACVAEGCFPGDTAGFPVQITSRGSYVLTSNLTVTSTTTSAITLNANNVNLDLQGFHIGGPTSCSGTPLTCTPDVTGHGIDGTALTQGNTVINGSVSGFLWGVATDLNWRVERIISEHNKDIGFFVRKGTVISGSTARYNGNVGFQVGELGRLTDSVATRNRNAGISTFDTDTSGGDGGATLESNTVYLNGQGIRDRGRSLIVRNTIFNNDGYGVRIGNGGSQLIENSMMDNGGLGLDILAGTFFSASGLPVLMSGNMLSNNNSGNDQPQIGGAGIYIELTPNLCGDDMTCP